MALAQSGEGRIQKSLGSGTEVTRANKVTLAAREPASFGRLLAIY
jgi:hypothetical protein